MYLYWVKELVQVHDKKKKSKLKSLNFIFEVIIIHVLKILFLLFKKL